MGGVCSCARCGVSIELAVYDVRLLIATFGVLEFSCCGARGALDYRVRLAAASGLVCCSGGRYSGACWSHWISGLCVCERLVGGKMIGGAAA